MKGFLIILLILLVLVAALYCGYRYLVQQRIGHASPVLATYGPWQSGKYLKFIGRSQVTVEKRGKKIPAVSPLCFRNKARHSGSKCLVRIANFSYKDLTIRIAYPAKQATTLKIHG